MAVVIRMKRTGRRKRPCYRISVADKRFPRDGKTLETLGLYDPIAPRPELALQLNVESARRWVELGAVPSPTVRSIFKREGVYDDPEAGPGAERRKVVRKRRGRWVQTATSKRRSARKEALQQRKESRRAQRKQIPAVAPAEG